MALKYTKKTIDNFLHPKNIGKIRKADAEATVGNVVCGDQLSFSLKVVKGRIKDIKFLSFGCASNIATASVITEKVKGLTLEEAKKYPWQNVIKELGSLPQQKVHCSILAAEGVQAVIDQYEKNLNKEIKKVMAKDKVKKVVKKKVVKKKVVKKK